MTLLVSTFLLKINSDDGLQRITKLRIDLLQLS